MSTMPPDSASPYVPEGKDPSRSQEIVGVAFDKTTRADEVLLALIHLQQEGEIAMADAVVVAKDEDGRVHIRQTIDPTPGRSAITGTFWGMLVGAIIGGPVFWVGAAVGAGSAALAAKLIDLGLDDHWVRQVADWLDPGTSALLLLVADDLRPAVVSELDRYEGHVLYCTFPDAVRQELERALDDVSYRAGDPEPALAPPPEAPSDDPTEP